MDVEIADGEMAPDLLPAGVKVHLAFGYTDMRKGMDGLAVLVQKCCIRIRSPGIFVFGGAMPVSSRSCSDGTGQSFTKRLEHGVFVWPANIEPGRTPDIRAARIFWKGSTGGRRTALATGGGGLEPAAH
ncbi:MAG: IS66 family insertion sequence element accessory protein TnpB [Defluviimonas denitrificans]